MWLRLPGCRKGVFAHMLCALSVFVAAASLAPQIEGVAHAKTVLSPDIRGVWERFPNPVATDADVFGDIQPPGDGPALREPYASEWKALRAKRVAAAEAGKPLVDESTKCLPEGMPQGRERAAVPAGGGCRSALGRLRIPGRPAQGPVRTERA